MNILCKANLEDQRTIEDQKIWKIKMAKKDAIISTRYIDGNKFLVHFQV